MDISSWNYLFNPKSIAVIGASNAPGSWGLGISRHLPSTPEREIFLVNPKAPVILGKASYPSVSSLPGPFELAVIVVPPSQVLATLRECIAKGARAAVVVTAGFAEMGDLGRQQEAELVETARQGGIRFIGPNTMGHANTHAQLSTLAFTPPISPGPVGLISQSGNYGGRITTMAQDMGIGFSKFVSTGNEADLHLEDYLEYLIQDEQTKIIAAYIEGLREGRRFFELARQATLKKPIVVLKSGGTGESARAVMSHTGALAGADAIYSAAFRQSGVIRAEDDDELCDLLPALLYQPLPRGRRVGILTVGGGLGVVATESCEREGLEITRLSPSTLDKLNGYLPPRWSHGNPIDMAGISFGKDFPVFSCLWALMEDDNVDAVLLQTPVTTTGRLAMGLDAAEAKAQDEAEHQNLGLLRERIKEQGKPVLLVTAVPEQAGSLTKLAYLQKEGSVVYHSPRRAARVLRHLVAYRRYLDSR